MEPEPSAPVAAEVSTPIEAEARERLSEIRRAAEKQLEERVVEEPLEERAAPGPNKGGSD
jgi:hypothetical protein